MFVDDFPMRLFLTIRSLHVPHPHTVDELCEELGWDEAQQTKMKTSLGQFLAKDSVLTSAIDLADLSQELDIWRFTCSKTVAGTPSGREPHPPPVHEGTASSSATQVVRAGPGVCSGLDLNDAQNSEQAGVSAVWERIVEVVLKSCGIIREQKQQQHHHLCIYVCHNLCHNFTQLDKGDSLRRN